jgi:hypothetical protein
MKKITKGQFLTNGKIIVIVTRGCSKDGEKEFRGTILATILSKTENNNKSGTTKRFNKNEFDNFDLYFNLKQLLEDYLN